MAYARLKDCVLDLEKHGRLLRIPQEVDPYLEMAEIHRRIHDVGGPAIFFEKIKGSPFPAVSNLFGTLDRARFLFRDTLEKFQKLVRLKADPSLAFRDTLGTLGLGMTALRALPKRASQAPVLECKTEISQLPQIQCWPKDAGPFILLPQVYTEHPDRPGILHSNLGMYRIQMAGNQYETNRQIGLHYQIRRDIGIHHTRALERGEKLRVSIFVGGPPAHTFAAVMYLPEGLSEVQLAGALAGRAFRYVTQDGYTISADADFCITGYVEPGKNLPEGPFGDHLGYYCLQHDFPYLTVESVYHRRDAIWPFTVVGRPPQEDSFFGQLVQEIASPMIPKEIPGVKEVHAVDASGVHPLLLAIGSERYVPYQDREPREILTHANALLGYGPCSLAKYVLIAAAEDNPQLSTHDIPVFFTHLLERIDWARDLHFQTRTTMDTLDYSGTGLNTGSKVVMAAAGNKKRELATKVPGDLRLVAGFEEARLAMPGVVVIKAARFSDYGNAQREMERLAQALANQGGLAAVPLWVTVDDSEFAAQTLNAFLWVTFTRSDPAHDLYGVNSFTDYKHWGCRGPLLIDARIKPHHAPPLEADKTIRSKVEKMAVSGGVLHGVI